MDTTFELIVGTLFLLGAAVAFARAITEMVAARQSKRWPNGEATVVRSRIEESPGVDGGILFGAHIRYTYEVAGECHSCDRVRFGGAWSHSFGRAARGIVSHYPVGAKVRVAYDPANPSQAVLEPGNISTAVGTAVFSLLLLAFGVWAVLAA